MIGGTRFFGKRYVELMLKEGHTVTLLTRGLSVDSFGTRVSRLTADRTDSLQFRNAIRSDYDLVVDNILMNAQEAKSAVEVLGNRTNHYIMTSTISVYDPRPGPLMEIDFEALIPHPGETYQHGKRSAEHALAEAAFGVSILRIPVVVGPDDYTQRLLTHVRAVKMKKKLYFPNPDATFSFLHAQDAARALSWLSEAKPCGVYNVAAPHPWTLRELMDRIGKITGQSFEFGGPADGPSPFGVTQDYYLDITKAEKAGFRVDGLEKWMPGLIEELAKRVV